MNISKIVYAVLTAGVLLTVVPSCNKDDNNDVNNKVNSNETYSFENEDAISKAKIAGKVAPEIIPWSETYNDFLVKVGSFSSKIATAIGCEQSKNTAVSPLSVFMAMSMAAECAGGETREEILNMLGISYEELSTNIQELCYECNRILGYYDEEDKDKAKNMIKCVNSLWIKDGANVKESGIESLTTNYYSDVFKMDFLNSNVNELVTSYIKNETRGFLAPNLELEPSTLIMLMNVVYLKEVWNEYGENLGLTDQKYDFQNYDKTKTSTKLLRGDYNSGKALVTEKYRKFYTSTNSGLDLTFYVPNEGYSVDDIYNTDVLDDKTSYVYSDSENRYHTRCIFPEFSASYDSDIKEIIKSLGIKSLFGGCDFSNLTDQDVFCGQIQHVTKLEVKKEGIEGAAVTAVMMMESAGPAREELKDVYEDFVVDKNFVYVLSRYNIPLFTGVVKKIEL
jgi:serpin B